MNHKVPESVRPRFTLAAIKVKLRGIPSDAQGKVVCALIGHSRIVSACFGYINCGRCDALVADNLAGAPYSQAAECVQIGHNCKACRANFKKMDWRDKFLVANPFKGERAQ